MGWYFRKSIGLGPFRVNLSRSGIGYSLGGRGFRVGVDSRGRSYSSFGIPGTGVGYRTTAGRGCLILLGFGLALVLVVLGLAWKGGLL